MNAYAYPNEYNNVLDSLGGPKITLKVWEFISQMKFGPFLLSEFVILNVDLNLCTHLGARCRSTEFILVLEIEEFCLP